MNLKDYLHPDLILLNQSFPDRNSAIEFLADKLDKAGKLTDKNAFIRSVMDRENEGPTALGEELAVPHGKSETVKEACVAIAQLNQPMPWEGVDGPEPVKLIVMLAIPLTEQGTTHIELLTELTTRLVDDSVRNSLMTVTSTASFLEILCPETRPNPTLQNKTAEETQKNHKSIVCVTACPTGIAHTYMAAEYLEKAGKKLGITVYVEKQGAKGIEGQITQNQLKEADAAIIAADVAIKDGERFARLPTLKTTVSEPIRHSEEVINKALALPPKPFKNIPERHKEEAENTEKQNTLGQVKKSLLTGVSHAIPFIAAGGIMIAMAIAFAPMTSSGPDFSHTPILRLISDIGGAAFAILLPVLAGYISYGAAGRPGLVAGFVGGYLSNTVGAGFLGAILAGLIAGYIVNQIKKLPMPSTLQPLMPILIIPIISSLIVGIVMLKVIGVPIASIMDGLGQWLRAMGDANAAILGLILGCMIAADMGGPINKAAFFFGAAMIQEGNYAIMGAIAAAICVPPISMGLATKLAKKYWTSQEQEAGTAAMVMGMIGITEGAIPFAVADPIRVIPSIMCGSAVASAIAMVSGVGDHAPHGGPIVLPVIDGRIMYVIAIIIGVIVSALMINALKKLSHNKKFHSA
ncbi:PTS system 2-O-alpha-mannosyl-D-glycerate-specific EIIABC component [invertebrate metagenome]|uniref:PTS system 2-O-alpha-mannosyl-D-glycerate-specific EIIABC component n=1 Tax=invertebrate metagenome TaxID=1711999 RepID=A0A2H9T7I9_9ZZZZ